MNILKKNVERRLACTVVSDTHKEAWAQLEEDQATLQDRLTSALNEATKTTRVEAQETNPDVHLLNLFETRLAARLKC